MPMQELVNVVVVTAPPGTAWTLSWNGLSDRKGVPPEALRSRLDAISGSVFNLPQWLEKKAAVLAQWGNEDEARAALALARSNAIREQSLRNTQQNSAALEHTLQANRERNQAQEEARTARQSAIDRNWERSTDTVVGRDNRRNPYDGTQFKSDVNTEYVWVNKDGRKIGTNNSTYNPNYDSSKSGDWQLAPKGY
ncbi:hypothetical protein AGMMS50256_30270 [Betaproteobacteria bacterium]|nr:hypothetical protein AGMMS50256_30270 [Betaproteobacteria bacterium]